MGPRGALRTARRSPPGELRDEEDHLLGSRAADASDAGHVAQRPEPGAGLGPADEDEVAFRLRTRLQSDQQDQPGHVEQQVVPSLAPGNPLGCSRRSWRADPPGPATWMVRSRSLRAGTPDEPQAVLRGRPPPRVVRRVPGGEYQRRPGRPRCYDLELDLVAAAAGRPSPTASGGDDLVDPGRLAGGEADLTTVAAATWPLPPASTVTPPSRPSRTGGRRRSPRRTPHRCPRRRRRGAAAQLDVLAVAVSG